MNAIESRGYSRSRAILVGTSSYNPSNGMTDIPAAENSFWAMKRMLMSPQCGWPENRISEFLNVPSAEHAMTEITDLIAATRDVLLFYYVGHGIPTDDGRDLCLTTCGTVHRSAKYSSLLLSGIRGEASRPAHDNTTRIILLDCCYAGVGADLASDSPDLTGALDALSSAEGFVTLTASGAHQKAFYDDRPGGLSYFTQCLTEIVENGVQDNPPVLTMLTIYEQMEHRFHALKTSGSGRQDFKIGFTSSAYRYQFARNVAVPLRLPRDVLNPPSPRPSEDQIHSTPQLNPRREDPSYPGLPGSNRSLLAGRRRFLTVAALGALGLSVGGWLLKRTGTTGTGNAATSPPPTDGATQGVADPARSAYSYSSEGANVTVDLSSVTGKTVQPYLYGYATGALFYDDFQLAANGAVESSAKILTPSLIRFSTSVTTIIQTVFAKGVSKPDWTPFYGWIQYHADFLRSGGRVVFGIGPAGNDRSIPPATWAQYARATALHFREIGQEITYWEAGNQCDPMGATVYSQYFNAIADALHSVNRGYLVGGPVASWFGGIDLPTFARLSGSRLGFIDFHSYPVSDTDSAQIAYERAAAFADAADARQAVKGTAAARLPIGLLEYNMNGARQPDGLYGLPAQGTITGAVYAALLLTRAFTSDPGFTMAAMWDLVANSNYGAIGNAQDKASFRAIDEQGWYLRQAARLMPGQQAAAATTAPGLQVLATTSGGRFSIQLVNYNLDKELSANITIKGRAAGSTAGRWELSTHYPSGHVSTTANLARVPLPPQSIVILSGRQ